VRDVLERVGDTWTVLVVLRLGEQPMRFRELLRAVEGISQRMLTVTLRALERDGLVLRRVFDTRPPAVQYRLTARGVSLLEPVTALALWALQNDPGIERSRAAFDQGAN
jgi:DNA-binding HxlR family transcriptional regulator